MRRKKWVATIALALLVIACGISFTLLVLRLTTLTAPQAAILAPVVTGGFTVVGLYLNKRLNLAQRDPAVVYYGQEVVVRAHRAEYVCLEADAKGRKLKATGTERPQAQRFIIGEFLGPFFEPFDKPVRYGDKIAIRAAREPTLVTACRDLEKSPLYLLAKEAADWEMFLVMRSDDNERNASDRLLRFGDTLHLKTQNERWVYCDYNNDRALYAWVDAAANKPHTYESFAVENPSAV